MVVSLGHGRQVTLDVPFQSPGEDRTRQWGLDLGRRLPPGCVVGLAGELGAGKTVLASGLLHGAGLDASIPVTSPTYTLVNRYPGERPFVHVDLYRVESAREAFDAGIEEILLEPGPGLVVVEWFEKFPELWPPDHLRLDLEVTAPETRIIRAGGRDV
jgi:tRNA threonylcarbamoyladenosine biosynthesis protein TsaE